MGIFDVISSIVGNNSNSLTCPKYDSDVHEQDVWYFCDSCDIRFILKDGRLLDPFDSSDWDSGNFCANCQHSLTRGDHVMVWEEGNSGPYTICSSCAYHNF